MGASSLVLKTQRARGTLVGYKFHQSALSIKAQVNFVSADEAKELIAEGYSILDVRDITQYDRAHIKDCKHVPFFIENKDNDLGKNLCIYTCFHFFKCVTLLIAAIFLF